ncbi:hypothetical protein KY347_04585 [Candidatus Woesearchaeota archaeon]|nr:hypothetical protein [Candidatus Woesearchaeota archaeon]
MKKIKVSFAILLAFLLIFSAAGCIKKTGGSVDYKAETDGLKIKFLERTLKDRYVIGERDIYPMIVELEVENKGGFPKKEDLRSGSRWSNLMMPQIKLSGFDKNIITDVKTKDRLVWDSLLGVDYSNPEGSLDTILFSAWIQSKKITDSYEPNIMATICYPYATKAEPEACIDPRPSEEDEHKVCSIGTKTLTSQGAPVAITKIEQEASSDKMQFKIHIKNIGNGEVIKFGSLWKCSSQEARLEKDDFDRINLASVEIGYDKPVKLDCKPFADGSNNLIRLYEGEGVIICSFDMSDSDVKYEYTTPLKIVLEYGYSTTISKNIKILKMVEVD